MKPLFTDDELGISLTTSLQRGVLKCVKVVLGLNGLNRFYESLGQADGVEFAKRALDKLNVERVYDPNDMEKIPATGGVIIIANHPYGALDGLLMMDTVLRYRADAKFMGNFLLSRIEPLADMFISVDPFEANTTRNIGGVRRSLEHLAQGKALIIFPAGEVSTYQSGFSKFGDVEWPASIVRFIRSTSLPVVPIHISGKNSFMFHLVGKIHHRLRTLRLVRELLNKKGKRVEIAVGEPLTSKLLHSIDGDANAALVMRANIALLNNVDNYEISNRHPVTGDSISETDNELIAQEIGRLPSDAMLSEIGSMKLYFCTAEHIEHTLKKIGELREQTFRAANEGTMSAIDTDAYDAYYHHLFIWDQAAERIVGAYRVGFGEELFRQMGVDAFYTHTLFDFSHKFFPFLRHTIELGRSFVVADYQRKAHPLLLLWRGLLVILMRSEGYRYMIGTVSISSEYTSAARRLMVSYLKAHNWSQEFSRFVVARHGIHSLARPIFDVTTTTALKSTDIIDKFIRDVDSANVGMPTLLKRYAQIGGEVLSLNVDKKNNDSLDALMMLDIKKLSTHQLEILTREFNVGAGFNYKMFHVEQDITN